MLLLTVMAMPCDAQLSKQNLTTQVRGIEQHRKKIVITGLIANQFWTAHTLTNGHTQRYIAQDKYGHYWVIMSFSGTVFFLTHSEMLGWGSSLTLIFGKELYDQQWGGTGFSWLDVQTGLTSTLTMYLVYKYDN